MSDRKDVVNVTLEFTVRPSQIDDLDIICESMMQGAVDYTTSDACGLGFSYNYTKKKSRRGMTIKQKRALEGGDD